MAGLPVSMRTSSLYKAWHSFPLGAFETGAPTRQIIGTYCRLSVRKAQAKFTRTEKTTTEDLSLLTKSHFGHSSVPYLKICQLKVLSDFDTL